jgi:hypothetical protein
VTRPSPKTLEGTIFAAALPARAGEESDMVEAAIDELL